MSIHKSQGQTLERVKVDLGRIFEKGLYSKDGSLVEIWWNFRNRRSSICGAISRNFVRRTSNPQFQRWEGMQKFTTRRNPPFTQKSFRSKHIQRSLSGVVRLKLLINDFLYYFPPSTVDHCYRFWQLETRWSDSKWRMFIVYALSPQRDFLVPHS